MAINSSVFNQKSWLRTVTGSVGRKVALEQ
jgi:hypothetical protein